MNIKAIKNKLYARSPFNLATTQDNAYRDGVDYTLEEVDKAINSHDALVKALKVLLRRYDFQEDDQAQAEEALKQAGEL